jgi:integron integrase
MSPASSGGGARTDDLGPAGEGARLTAARDSDHASARDADRPAASDPPRAPRLLDRLRAAIRIRHYSPRTEETYVHWTRSFVRFHGLRHPRELGAAEIEAFLSHLATERNVAASTQNQALNALVFLYRHVLGHEMPVLEGLVRARTRRPLPVVLSRAEVAAVLTRLQGQVSLVASLLYGSGLRLGEALELRVKDLDFDGRAIRLRQGKGRKDRVTMLPEAIVTPLQEHLLRVRELHQSDRALGFGQVMLPHALAAKYVSASYEWGWQWVFPAARRYRDATTGVERRHHLHETVVQKAMKRSLRLAGIVC